LDSAGINGIEAAYYLYDALRKVEAKWNTEEERKACPQSKPYDSNPHPINFNLVRPRPRLHFLRPRSLFFCSVR
jgi:hypothetical protein